MEVTLILLYCYRFIFIETFQQHLCIETEIKEV
jgi:hypothetical protein